MGKVGPSVRSWRVVHGGNLDAPLLEEGRCKHERSLAFYVVTALTLLPFAHIRYNRRRNCK